jgi:signal transduction histidine kinase
LNDLGATGEKPSTRLLTVPTILAIVLTEGASVAEAWTRGRSAMLLLTAVAITFVSTGAVALADRGRPRAARGLAFGNLPLGLAVTAFSHSTILLGLFPIVSVAEITWPIVGSLGTITVFIAGIAWVGFHDPAWAANPLAQAGAFVGGGTFAIVFTRIAVAERRARSELERLLHANAEANRRLSEYAAVVGDLSAARERNRIARDIHDGVAHGLTIVHVQLEAARAVSGEDPRALEVRSCVERAQRAAREALADVRQSVGAIRGEPSRSLPEDLAALVEACRSSGLDAELLVVGFPRVLAPAAEFALRRATQEALTNVRRHSQASSVRVRLEYREDSVRLAISDDGRGANAPGAGFGLVGMRERVELLGGVFELRTAPGQGFAIEIRLTT